MNSHLLILSASGILVLSFLANILAKRTNIPSVLMLMLIGFGIQQFAQVDQASLRPYLEILGTVGVILIVLEAALDLHIEKEKWPLIIRSTLVAALCLFVTSGLIALVLKLAYGMGTLQGLIYAVPLAVLSSAIVIPSVGRLKSTPKEFLIFESAISDILGIIIFYGLLDLFRAGGTPDVVVQVGGKILLTMIMSVVISYLLIWAFQSISGGSVRLFLLISILMGLYSAGKLLHLSPLILILVFGLALNNKHLFFPGKMNELVNEAQFDNILKDLRFITLESAFVVRTFFFVAFGMSIVLGSLLHWTVPLVTLLAIAIIYGVRFAGLRAFTPDIIEPAIYVAPRGLITVLLFYAIPEAAASESFQPGIVLLTILISSLVMTYGLIREQKITQAEKAAKKAAAARRRENGNAEAAASTEGAETVSS